MRSLLAAVVAVVAVVACSSTGSPAVSPSTSPSASTAIVPSVPAPTPDASPATPRPSPSLVFPHDDPALEALLPDDVDGTKLLKLSVSPISTAGAAGAQGMKDLAERIGDGSGSFGLAYAGDPGGGFNLFALHIPGAEGSDLLTQFAQMTLAETVGGSVEASNLGGRDVVHVVDPVSEIGDVWFYADGETLLGVQAGSETEATELLALLQN